jgi:hypothetical protein
MESEQDPSDINQSEREKLRTPNRQRAVATRQCGDQHFADGGAFTCAGRADEFEVFGFVCHGYR